MAASLHVKSKTKWKPVKLDPKLYTDKHFGGLICVEELRDYELVKDPLTGEGSIQIKEVPDEKDGKKKVGKSIQKKFKPKRKLTVGESENKDENTKKPKLVNPVKLKESTDEQNSELKPEIKVSRKKKKLLKWKQKERLKKEARRAHIVTKQTIVSMTTDEILSESSEEIKKASDKNKNQKKPKLKPEKQYVPNDNQEQGKAQKKKRTEKPKPLHDDSQEKKTDRKKINHDMSAWFDLHVPPPVLDALSDMGFTSPMPIQSLALPSAIRDSMDIVGAAKTGSGKTLAFAIPVIHHILKYKERKVKNEEMADSGHDEELETNNSDYDVNDASDDAIDDASDDLMNEDSDVSSDVTDDVTDRASDEGYDNPPDDEELNLLEDDGTGLVKVLNNVEFDWLEEEPIKKKVPNSGSLLCLVLTPTRELAVQVKNHIEAVAKYTDIKVGLLVGGMAPQKQKRLLKRCPEIVVATPGRLWELIEEGDSYLTGVEDIKFLVIDEADRMVEKGHFEELSILLERINANERKRNRRQTFIFSATLTVVHSTPTRFDKKKKKVTLTSDLKLEKLMKKIGIKDRPKIIDLSGRVGTADTLTEAKIHCATDEKDGYLYYLTRQYPGRTLVFANSKDCIRRLLSIFTLLEKSPLTLHADMHQKQRLKNLEKFTADDKGFLLATDVAARGLDIPHVQHVIHYQVPRTTENYVHRSGRTARANNEGLSVMLIGPDDMKNYKKIIYTLNKNEDLPMFPVEYQYYNELKERVGLARQIDLLEHRFAKLKHQNDWFQKAAIEVDVELDEALVLNDLGDQGEQSELKASLRRMKEELKRSIKRPLSSYSFSGKYPTKSGKLVLPKQPDVGEDAVTRVKKDRVFQAKVLGATKPVQKTVKTKSWKQRKWQKKL